MVLMYNIASKAARVGYNIPINFVGASFVNMPFHKKTGRVSIKDRVKLTSLKRTCGSFDIAKMLLLLASDAGNYLIGKVNTIAGVD